MHKNDTSGQGCCTDAACDSGLRNHYFEGKRLTAESFRIEQDYLLDRRHLLNRALHGWGVVYGYSVKPARTEKCRAEGDWGALRIGPGLALDKCGRELLWTHAKSLHVEDVVLVDDKGQPLKEQRPPEGSYEPYKRDKGPDQERQRACWLLSAHYAEQDVGALSIKDPCSCERKEWDRVCETVRFTLKRIECKDCCATFNCELDCGCGTGRCCEQHGREPAYPGDKPRQEAHSRADDPRYDESPESADELANERKETPNPLHRGGCQCLCEHLMHLERVQCDTLRSLGEECAHVRADLCHGVPLACVHLREGDCDNWMFDGWVEACGPRRVVKRNDELFDLIRGCDLTRISAIGWADWHRRRDRKNPVEWSQFSRSFGTESPAGESATTKYWVKFSRPVLAETVRPDCFSMTVLVSEDEGGWSIPRRVPIVGVKTKPAKDMPGYVTAARLVVDAGWVEDAINGRKTIFDQIATVEIEIRGDFIIDCNGQAVDADAIGLSPAPTGNGSPGGTFLSSFEVEAHKSESRAAG